MTRTAVFAVVYVLATVAGRLTVMDGTNLSMVWPAAGVLVLWFSVQRQARCRWADFAALTMITLVVNTATGASGRLAVVFVLANIGQVWMFLRLTRWWQPALWGVGGSQPLRRLRDLWTLLGAAAASTAAGAGVGTSGMWLITGHYSWPAAGVWLARNTASVLLIGAVGLRLGYAWHARPAQVTWRSTAGRIRAVWHATPGWRIAEYAGLIGCSGLAYWVGFAVVRGLPVAFTLIAVTVWAALRTPTTFVVLHDLAVGTVAVLFTLHGTGAFAAVTDNATRALIAQLFVGVVAVVGLALALGRDERVTLLGQLAADKVELAAAAEALRAELHARSEAETELRAATEALSGQKAYLTQVLDAIDVTVITCDISGRIVHANRTAQRALPADAAADSITTATPRVGLTHPDGTPIGVDDTPLARALHGDDVDGMDAVIALPDGRIKALLLHSRPLTDATGTIIGAVAASHDVTALRDREADLRAFAGVAAHDLKSPLAVIAAYAEILDDDLPTAVDPAVRSSVARIRGGVHRMRRLIDDLLHYATARDAPLHPEPVDLNDIVVDVIAERTAHLRATTTAGEPVLFPDIYTGPLPTVHADRAMTRQLVDNLVGNALKYTVPGQPARIDISAHHRPGDPQARIVIADRGIGIPDVEKPHVFTSFRRAGNHGNRPGTGLGLAICHRIIERHQAAIGVTDNPGGGTRIWFTLPTVPTPAPAAGSIAAPAVVEVAASTTGPLV